VVDGKSFGVENYFRISYAVSKEDIKEACKRMLSACEKLTSA
jgi:aspartate aminotransferase